MPVGACNDTHFARARAEEDTAYLEEVPRRARGFKDNVLNIFFDA